MDKLKAIAEKTGLKQFVVKTPENSTESILQQTALNYMKAADMLETFGVRLLLHNEAGDIQTKIAGKTAYEHLLDLCMGKVGAQVDVGWVQFGGEDPVAFLERNAARVQSVHHKVSVWAASRLTCGGHGQRGPCRVLPFCPESGHSAACRSGALWLRCAG